MPFRQRCFTQKDKNPIDPLKKDCGFSWSKLDGISDYFQTEHVASLKPKTLPDAFRQDQTPRLIDMYGFIHGGNIPYDMPIGNQNGKWPEMADGGLNLAM